MHDILNGQHHWTQAGHSARVLEVRDVMYCLQTYTTIQFSLLCCAICVSNRNYGEFDCLPKLVEAVGQWSMQSELEASIIY